MTHTFAGLQVETCQDEEALLRTVISAVQALDPDIMVAFDLMRGSIGYLQVLSPCTAVSQLGLRSTQLIDLDS